MKVSVILGYAVGPIATAVFSFITVPVLAWLFSQEDIGRLSMLQVTLNFSTVLFCMGLDQAYVREYHESDDKPSTLLAAGLPGLVLLLLVLSGVLIVAPGKISELLFSIDSKSFSLVVALCLLASYVSRYLSLILRMQDRGLAFSMSQLLPKLILLCIAATYFFALSRREFVYLLGAQAISIGMATVVFSWNTRLEWIPACRSRLSSIQMAKMFGYGYPLVLGAIASWGLSAMDRVFLRSLATYEELAIYSVAASAAAAVTIISGIFNTIWSPMVYQWSATGAGLEKIEPIARYLLACVALVIPVAGMFSWTIAYLLPHSYAKVPYLLIGCMVSPLLYTLSEVTSIGIALSRRTVYSMIASIVAVLANVVLNYLLIPIWGAAGATMATMIAFFLFFVCRTEFSRVAWKHMPRRDCYIVMLVLVSASCLFAVEGSKWPVVSGCLWAILGAIILFIFKEEYVVALSYLKALVNKRATG